MQNITEVLNAFEQPVLLWALGGFILAFLATLFWVYRNKLKIRDQRLEIQTLLAQKQELEKEVQNNRINIIRLEEQKKNLEQLAEKRQEDQQTMQVHFENLSNKIFEEKTKKFKAESTENIAQMLNPLRERINDFQKKVDDSFSNHKAEQVSLKNEIKNIISAHEKMTTQAESLTKALKGDNKTQGDWGEIKLERLLEDSGLQKGTDYILQGTGLGLKHPETGGAQKPDVIVNLPEKKHVIIDSKVSLTHYERFCSDDGEAEQAVHLKEFLLSVRQHVKDLERRRYQDTENLGTPEIVLMFMPIEGAFTLALQQDHGLHKFAWDKKVAIVCPSTLFATLKTISSLWRLAKQNQNAHEIAERSGALYDKIAGFVEDMQLLGKQLTTVEKTYQSSMKKLSEGQGNILRRTEGLKKMGAKTSKALPSELIEAEEDDESLEAIQDDRKRA